MLMELRLVCFNLCVLSELCCDCSVIEKQLYSCAFKSNIRQSSQQPGKPGNVREFCRPGKVGEKSGNSLSSQGKVDEAGENYDVLALLSVVLHVFKVCSLYKISW